MRSARRWFFPALLLALAACHGHRMLQLQGEPAAFDERVQKCGLRGEVKVHQGASSSVATWRRCAASAGLAPGDYVVFERAGAKSVWDLSGTNAGGKIEQFELASVDSSEPNQLFIDWSFKDALIDHRLCLIQLNADKPRCADLEDPGPAALKLLKPEESFGCGGWRASLCQGAKRVCLVRAVVRPDEQDCSAPFASIYARLRWRDGELAVQGVERTAPDDDLP